MHFKALCILLLIKTLKMDAKGHRPFPKSVHGIGEVTPVMIVSRNENINLPNGFSPQPSPINPMLYPFATEQPIGTIEMGSTSGWRPIVKKGTTKIPVLEDRFETVSLESNREIGTVQGQTMGKPSPPPHHPLRSMLQQAEFVIPGRTLDIGSPTSTNSNGVWRQIGGYVEATNYKKPVATSPKQQTKTTNRISTEKHGRRRIANFTDEKKHQSPAPKTNDFEKRIKVNVTDDSALLSIAKQINESVEYHRFPDQTSNEPVPNFDTDTTTSNESLNQTSSRDLADSHASNNISHERNISNKFFNFFDDSSETTNGENGEANYDDIFSPTSSFNITKVGVPFEDQNSAEELSICVPLSVRERSLSNENEIVDVERVYCFPLPTPDKTKYNENRNTTSVDGEDVFGTLNYENPTNSNALRIKATLAVICIGIFLI